MSSPYFFPFSLPEAQALFIMAEAEIFRIGLPFFLCFSARALKITPYTPTKNLL